MSPSWSSSYLGSTQSPLLFPEVLLSRCARKLTLLHVGKQTEPVQLQIFHELRWNPRSTAFSHHTC